MTVEFEVCPVGGHNMNGKVERRIKHIKESLEKSSHNERLSILQWETLASTVANSINDLPLALGNITSDYENMDLLTPNRLRLGRNNNRSPTGPMFVTNHPSKILADNTKIFNTWFDVWLVSHVPKLIEQPKWFKTDRDIQHGDVILFIKQDNALSNIYQYGMVHQTERSKDDVIRKAQIRYRNSNENIDRYTWRAVRQLIVIHPVDEINLMEDLGRIASTDFSSN